MGYIIFTPQNGSYGSYNTDISFVMFMLFCFDDKLISFGAINMWNEQVA